MTTTYLIRLHPLDSFFFGGETTFGENNADYFAKSNPLPQQSTLLGALRQLVLFQNLGRHKVPDEALIGAESFHPDGSVDDFGCIQGISPLMLWQDAKDGQSPTFSLPACRAQVMQDNALQVLAFQPEPSGKSRINGAKAQQLAPKLAHYAAKNDLESLWVARDGHTQMRLQGKGQGPVRPGILHTVFQVGIAKEKLLDRDNDEGAYFKKHSYRMDKGHAFAFLVRLASPATLNDDLICIGGERSPFAVKVSAWEGPDPFDQPDDFYRPFYAGQDVDPAYSRLLCLSDAFVSDEVFDRCVFAQTGLSTFRNLRSKLGTTRHYSGLGHANQHFQPHKTARRQLLAKGSVLYCLPAQEDHLRAAFQHPGYQLAGFNHFHILPAHPGHSPIPNP